MVRPRRPFRYHSTNEIHNAAMLLSKIILMWILWGNTPTYATINGIVNGTVTLPCAIEPGPDIEAVHWTVNSTARPVLSYFPKDDSTGPPGYDPRFSTLTSLQLIISTLKWSDSGKYTCIITSLKLPADLEYTVNLTVLAGCTIWTYDPPLHASENGCNSGGLLRYGETCSYSCQEGFKLIGNSSTTCMANGMLDSRSPYCTALYCHIESLPPHLTDKDGTCVNQSQIKYGTVCMFQCKEGYSLTGSGAVSVKCSNEDGPIQSTLPQCEEIIPKSRHSYGYISFLIIPLVLVPGVVYWLLKFRKGRFTEVDTNENVADHPLIPLLHEEMGFIDILRQQMEGSRDIMSRILKIVEDAETKLIRESPKLKCKPIQNNCEEGKDNFEEVDSFAKYIFIVVRSIAQNNPELADELIDDILAATGDKMSESTSSKSKSYVPLETEETREVDNMDTAEENMEYLSVIHQALARLLIALRHSIEDSTERRTTTSSVFKSMSSYLRQKYPQDSSGCKSSKSSYSSSWQGSTGGNGLKSNQFFADKCLGDIAKCRRLEEEIELRYMILNILIKDRTSKCNAPNAIFF